MSDRTDPGGRRPRTRSGIVIALQIVLGILFLLPGACGGLFYFSALVQLVARWLRSGDASYADGFLLLATPSMLLSIILLGILMRLISWTEAPTVSLALSITATIVVVSASVMLVLGPELTSGLFGPDFLFENAYPRFALAAVVAWLVAAVPPFQHWSSRR